MELKVMTYNMKLAKESDLETIASVIASGEADVVAVQEIGIDWLEGTPGNHPKEILASSGLLHVRFASVLTVTPDSDPPEIKAAPVQDDRPAMGVALFSRLPLGPWTRHRLPKRQGEPRFFLSATVVLPAEDSSKPPKPVILLVAHLSHLETDRNAQLPVLLRHAQTQGMPIVIAGDLGAGPDDPALKQLAPMFRNAAGDHVEPNWPADAPTLARDHIYISKEFDVVEPARPLPLAGSSHLPVVARLSIAGARA